jgi:fatty-acyl-CoA synthase
VHIDPRKLSHVTGASEPPLTEATIGDVLAETGARWPEREALVVPHQSVCWTYGELKRHVDALAAGLLTLGLEHGDRVGIWSPNRAEWIVTQLATARVGLILVTINPAYRSVELALALSLSACRALVLASEFKGSNYLDMISKLFPDIGTRIAAGLDFLIQLDGPALPGAITYQDLLDKGRATGANRAKEHGPELGSRDPINIQFTSGTTGTPKGATLTHRNILNNAIFVARHIKLSEQDRVCLPVPLYHCFGMVMGTLACVATGAALVLSGESFDAEEVLRTIANERCTALYGVPTMFVAELDHPAFSTFDLASLRTGIMAGAPCPVEVMKRVVTEMHMREVTICYGMTETSPVSFQSTADADIETRTSTVGFVHPHVEAKVVDEDGRTVPLGQTGELLVRGYSVMAGYWAASKQTADVIDADGWMHTGDLATIDTSGRARIVGRTKEMIIRGGENIYPTEIENFLLRHPAVAEVAVFGVPDDKFGEEVCAWITTRAPLDEEAVRKFCDGCIAHFKIPRHIRFVDSFPMTVTGKIQKFEMRAMMRDELGRIEIRTA